MTKRKTRQPEEAVEDHFVHRGGEAAWLGGQGVADGIANGSDGLIAGVCDMQRRIVDLVAEVRQSDIQFVSGVAGIGPAVDITFQHLQAQPAPLAGRDLRRHLLRQQVSFAQQRLRIVDQLNIAVGLVAVESDLQRFDPATAGRNQRNDRTAEAGGESIDINTHLLLFGNIQHVQRNDAGDPQFE